MHNQNLKNLAENTFKKALESIHPRRVVSSKIQHTDNKLTIAGKTYNLEEINDIYLVAFGKAAQAMTEGFEDAAPNLVKRGILLSNAFFEPLPDYYETHVCTHPLPVEGNARAAEKAVQLAKNAGADDLVICLVSGGGSSIFSLPAEGLAVADLAATADLLMRDGAPIDSLNAVRKHLDMVKGGRFLHQIAPAEAVTLCISDVPGDDPAIIASGPTIPDPSTFRDVMNVFEEHGLVEKIPSAVKTFVQQGVEGNHPETLKPGDPAETKNHCRVICSNGDMLQALARLLEQSGCIVEVDESHFEGEARDFGESLAELAKRMREKAMRSGKMSGFLRGGETTVHVKGQGQGGRNSEVALGAAIALKGEAGCIVLAAGTDGKDGPTDAAGAIADGQTIERAEQAGIDAHAVLAENDSFSLFEAVDSTVVTGPTGTNLMDIVMILASPE